MPELPFAKGHALGNDYIVVDAADLPWPLTAPRIRAMCDRHRGVGGDGILLCHLDRDPVQLRIFNPDGSEAEKSGNGLRIFAAYLHGRGLATSEPFRIELATDEVGLVVLGEAGAELDIAVDMGRADFAGAAVGFHSANGEVLGQELRVDGEGVPVHTVSLGNPHCVVFVDELRRNEFLRFAPRLAVHAAFAAGINVQFARVTGDDSLEVWIHERGAGETLASGSSACAVAAAAVRTGRVPSRNLRIDMPGGSVNAAVAEDWSTRLRGTAGIVFEGRLTEVVVRAYGELD